MSAASQRRRYAAQRAAGLCVYGGCAAPAVPGGTRCEAHRVACADAQLPKSRARYQPRPPRPLSTSAYALYRRARLERGLCICGAPLAPERARCRACLEDERARRVARGTPPTTPRRCALCGVAGHYRPTCGRGERVFRGGGAP